MLQLYFYHFLPLPSSNGKTLCLSALAGLASEGASQIVKKISGNGIQNGGFIIPQNKIDQFIAYKHLLTNKQSSDRGATSDKTIQDTVRGVLRNSLSKYWYTNADKSLY